MDENLPGTPGSHREDTFDIAVRGYHRGQVQEYMARSSQLLSTMEQHLQVARADAERARSEAEAARTELEQARSAPPEPKPVHEEVSSRLSQILKLAAEEADEDRAKAEAEINKLRADARAEAERAVAEARAEAEDLVSRARSQADSQVAEARATADSDLKRAREEADRLRLASVRQTQNLLDEARRRAGAVNEVSNHRLETLTATHGEAVLRLSQIRDVLADLLDRDSAAGSLAEVVEAVLAPSQQVPEVEDVELEDYEDEVATPDHHELVVDEETPAPVAAPISRPATQDEPVDSYTGSSYTTPEYTVPSYNSDDYRDSFAPPATAATIAEEDGEPVAAEPADKPAGAPQSDDPIDLRERRLRSNLN